MCTTKKSLAPSAASMTWTPVSWLTKHGQHLAQAASADRKHWLKPSWPATHWSGGPGNAYGTFIMTTTVSTTRAQYFHLFTRGIQMQVIWSARVFERHSHAYQRPDDPELTMAAAGQWCHCRQRSLLASHGRTRPTLQGKTQSLCFALASTRFHDQQIHLRLHSEDLRTTPRCLYANMSSKSLVELVCTIGLVLRETACLWQPASEAQQCKAFRPDALIG